MARYLGPKRRLSRREGISLYDSKKYSYDLRPLPPGEHGGGRRGKLSDYGIQLREKQKVKRLYGILEKQFRRYYKEAARMKGITGSNLLQLLERRLDNVIYRFAVARTREQARQTVGHGFVYVNDRKVNIPSFLVKPGDKVEVKLKKETTKKYFKETQEFLKDKKVPTWIKFDAKNLKGEINRLPEREDVDFPINEQLIVELYSK